MVSGRSTIPYSQGCTRHRPSKWVQPCGLVRRWRRDAAHGPSTSAAGFTMRCPTVRPASASSTTSQSGSGPCSMSTGSGGSCTSTSTRTPGTYAAVGRILGGLSSELCGGRWIAVGGGGYDVTAVPRVWTVLFATMVGLSLDDALPGSWLREGNQLVGTVPAGKALRDHARS